jgi:hypothetical protein
MELKEVLDLLHESEDFKKWKETDSASFLAHAFVLLDDVNKDTWQMGYFNPEKETITTFIVSEKHIERIDNQDVLRSQQAILELKVDQVKFNHDDALKKADEYHQQNHPREMALKKFFIIQQMDDHAIYNITYFFQSMKTLNMKINALDGEIIDSSIQALMEFDKGE